MCPQGRPALGKETLARIPLSRSPWTCVSSADRLQMAGIRALHSRREQGAWARGTLALGGGRLAGAGLRMGGTGQSSDKGSPSSGGQSRGSTHSFTECADTVFALTEGWGPPCAEQVPGTLSNSLRSLRVPVSHLVILPTVQCFR